MAKKTAKVSPFAAQLKKAQDTWAAGKKRAEERGSGPNYTDGRYEAKVVGAEIAESKSSSRLQVNWTFVFTKGDYKGKKVMDFSGLDREESVSILISRLGQFGYDDATLDDLEAILQEITKEGPRLRITLKTNATGEFQNVYINKVMAAVDADDEDDDDEDADEDEDENADDVEESDDDEEEEKEEEEEEEEEEEKPAKKAKAAAPVKTKGKKATPAEEEDDEEDDDADDDEEEVEEEEEDDEEEKADLEVGAAVVVQLSSGEKSGTVLEILAREGKVRVKTTDGKIVKVSVDKLELADTEEDVPAEPVKKAKKKS